MNLAVSKIGLMARDVLVPYSRVVIVERERFWRDMCDYETLRHAALLALLKC